MEGSLRGKQGSRELGVTAGLTMRALFPPCVTSAALRVEGREEMRWEHLPGPGERARPEERATLDARGPTREPA